MKTLFFSFISIVLFGTTVSAQVTANTSQTVTLNLQNQIDITFLSQTGTSFTFDSPVKYTDGLTNANASQIQVKSNKPWNVTVNASTDNFTGTAATTMPASVLGVRLNGGGAFTPLSTTAASLTSGGKGINSFNIDYNANPGFNYDQGSYTISVVYTATQQ